jgi:hypothetical protein
MSRTLDDGPQAAFDWRLTSLPFGRNARGRDSIEAVPRDMRREARLADLFVASLALATCASSVAE